MSFSNMSSVSSNSRSRNTFSAACGYSIITVSRWLCVIPRMISPGPPICGVNIRLRCPEMSMPSSLTACTAYRLGGWPSMAPNPADNTRKSASALDGVPENSLGHRAAANIASAYKKNGLHQLLNRKNLWLGSGIVNGEIRERSAARPPDLSTNPVRGPEQGHEPSAFQARHCDR